MTLTGEREFVLRCCLNIASDGVEVTCDGRLFSAGNWKSGREVERQ